MKRSHRNFALFVLICFGCLFFGRWMKQDFQVDVNTIINCLLGSSPIWIWLVINGWSSNHRGSMKSFARENGLQFEKRIDQAFCDWVDQLDFFARSEHNINRWAVIGSLDDAKIAIFQFVSRDPFAPGHHLERTAIFVDSDQLDLPAFELLGWDQRRVEDEDRVINKALWKDPGLEFLHKFEDSCIEGAGRQFVIYRENDIILADQCPELLDAAKQALALLKNVPNQPEHDDAEPLQLA